MTTPAASHSMNRKEGFAAFVAAQRPPRPDKLTTAAIAAMSPDERDDYNDTRSIWHANLGPLETPPLALVKQHVDETLRINQHSPDRVRPSVAIDGAPGLGKSMAMHTVAKQYARAQLRKFGDRTSEGHEHIPVVYITLTANTSRKSLNRSLCEFFMPAIKGTADQLASRAQDLVEACGTRMIVVDDIHFLNVSRRDGQDTVDHLKYLANILRVTFVFAGVDLLNRGLLSEGRAPGTAGLAQTGRRWTRIPIEPFGIHDDDQRRVWQQLLKGIELDLVLANAHRGMLSRELSDELYVRSTGNIGSLMNLINRACDRAITTGAETITKSLLDTVKIDEAAERRVPELRAAFDVGRLTTQPTRRSRPATTHSDPAEVPHR